MKQHKTAILMVSYNKSAVLDRCLEEIGKSVHKELFDVYVIDNGSKEDIAAVAKKHGAHFTRNEKNVFVSRALNECFFNEKIADRYEYAVFMANDVLVDGRTFIEMQDFMDKHPEVGVTGPVHYEWNSQIPRSRGLTINPVTSLLVNFMDDKPDNRMNHFHSMYLIRTDAFTKVRGFDHVLYPMIFEEPDVGERIIRQGYGVRCTLNAKIWHPIEVGEKKQEATKIDVRQDRLYSNKPKAYLFFRNRIIYMSLYSKWWQFLVFLIFNKLIFFYYLPTIKRQDIKYAIIGMLHGFRFAVTKDREYIKRKNKSVLGI